MPVGLVLAVMDCVINSYRHVGIEYKSQQTKDCVVQMLARIGGIVKKDDPQYPLVVDKLESFME